MYLYTSIQMSHKATNLKIVDPGESLKSLWTLSISKLFSWVISKDIEQILVIVESG